MLQFKPYPPHPISDIFPMKMGQSLDDLAASIKELGLLEEIVLYEGKVLDGRRRQAAAIKAGVKPLYRDFGSRASDGFDPLEWDFAVNFHRRDLSKAERAIAAAKFASCKKGFNQHTNVNGTKPVSQSEAAERFGAHPKTVARAAKVVNKGVPELQDAVLSETVSIADAATIAGENPKVQRKAIEAVQAGEVKTLKEAVHKAKGPPPIDPAAICRTLDGLIEQLERVDAVKVKVRGKAGDAREARELACESLKSARAFLRRLCHALGAAA